VVKAHSKRSALDLVAKDAETTLARGAVLASIASDVTVMLLERQGYTTAAASLVGGALAISIFKASCGSIRSPFLVSLTIPVADCRFERLTLGKLEELLEDIHPDADEVLLLCNSQSRALTDESLFFGRCT